MDRAANACASDIDRDKSVHGVVGPHRETEGTLEDGSAADCLALRGRSPVSNQILCSIAKPLRDADELLISRFVKVWCSR